MTNVNISRHLDTLLNTTIRNSGDRLRVIQKINDVIKGLAGVVDTSLQTSAV